MQQVADALLQRSQIIRDAPRHLLSARRELDSTDQIRRGLEPDLDAGRENFFERPAYRRALLLGQVERAAHQRRTGGRLDGCGKARFRRPVQRAQAAHEHLAHALFEAGRSQVGQCLARDREHFLLGPAADGLIEIAGVASQRFLSLRAQGVGGLPRFAEEPLQLNLAVSLHAATDEVRDRLVPLNRTYPLDEVFAACARYVLRTHRKVLFEYVVLRGVNDTDEQAQMLAARVRPPHYHLNLIAYNETGGEFARPRADKLATLRARLEEAGVSCTVRRSPGAEIEAACGQLALRRDKAAAQP